MIYFEDLEKLEHEVHPHENSQFLLLSEHCIVILDLSMCQLDVHHLTHRISASKPVRLRMKQSCLLQLEEELQASVLELQALQTT